MDKPTKTGIVSTVDQYMQSLPADMRTALEQLRQLIRAAAPEAEEVISYGIPAFKYKGMLVGFGAAKKHGGFYIMSAAVTNAFKNELAPYDTATATIRFSPDQPLPAGLVKKIVAARIKENTQLRESAAQKKKEKTKRT